MVGIENKGVSATKTRGRAAGGEEDLVGSLADIVSVYAIKLAEGPDEVGVGVVVVGPRT